VKLTMNLLLDTYVLIWVFSDDPRLSEQVKSAMANPDTIVFVSAVTAWEIAIKSALGKLSVPTNYQEGLRRYRFTPLDITTEHALAVEHLPHHHSDPFDRLLIVQAKLERLALITADKRMKAYDIRIIET
jgi:PIN domain nuclease of toxin-antitoxin system